MLKRYSTLIALSFGVVTPYVTAATPSVNPLTEQGVAAGDSLSVRISAWDPDGGVPGLYIVDMPVGSSFDDNGDGTRSFNWTPGVEDIGSNSFTVVASDAQADGSKSSSTLFVNVTDFDDSDGFDDYDDEPELIDATETALTSVGINGDFNFDTISSDKFYSLSIAEDVDVGFGGSDDLIFGVGSGTLPVFSDFNSESFIQNDQITGPSAFPWGNLSVVSADGRRLAVLDRTSEPVTIYENIADVWVVESSLGLSSSASDYSDYAIAYTSDIAMSGPTLVTGHPSHDTLLDGTRLAGSGAIKIYERSSSGWSTDATLVKAPNPDEHDQFGTAVALEGDIMVVSAIAEGSAGRGSNADMFNNDFKSEFPYSTFAANTSGAVYVYERILGSWLNTAYLKASDNSDALQFGWELAIDGNRIYVSAPARNIDTSLNHFDYAGNAVDKNEGAVYVFEKNTTGLWEETHIIESVDVESKFGLYLSAQNDAIAIGSAEATSLFSSQNNQWNNLWFARIAPYSVGLGNDVLAISTDNGLQVLTASEFVYADLDTDTNTDTDVDTTVPTQLAQPIFFGINFNNGVYSKTIQAGDAVSIVIGAWQVDNVPGVFIENSELGETFDDNGDGTRTFRWQSLAFDGGIFSFDLVATNALDSSVRSTATIEITIAE